jgi:phage/conjugal plasmid C-4 type zinc finger TraR family protein
MSDVLDEASAKEQRERETAIARVRGALAGEGSGTCADCGGEIAAERRQALPQARRCLACQQSFERRGT